MKKIICILTIVCFINQANGQSSLDSLYSILVKEIERANTVRNDYIDSSEAFIQGMLSASNTQIIELRNETILLKGLIDELTQALEGEGANNRRIESVLSSHDSKFSIITDKSNTLRDSLFTILDMLAQDLSQTRYKVDDVEMSFAESDEYMSKRIAIIFTIIVLLILIFVSVFWYSGKRANNVRMEFNNAKSDLEAQLHSNNILFVEKLEKSLQQLIRNPETVDAEKNSFDNRELIFDFAQQIANMENNIWTLPPDDRVRKRIERAVKKMRDTFMSLGYEMPKLLGTEVTQNQMIEIKSRSEDSELMPGQIIITRVLKPLILLNGKMEQRPIVDVKENSEE